MPGESVRFELTVVFAQKPPQVDLDGFKVKGTYLDRAQGAEYEVIAEWESAPTMEWHDPTADA